MRILHTMLRVVNLDASIAYYSDVLGMKLLRRTDYPEGKFTLAFLGYTGEAEGAVIELTHNWGVTQYEIGTAFGHVAIEVDNAYEACEKIKRLLFQIYKYEAHGPHNGKNSGKLERCF